MQAAIAHEFVLRQTRDKRIGNEAMCKTVALESKPIRCSSVLSRDTTLSDRDHAGAITRP
jgi:hypothetical protein